MMANFLIAASFFVIGAIVGGVLVLRSCWNKIEEQAKKLRETQSDMLIMRVYEVED